MRHNAGHSNLHIAHVNLNIWRQISFINPLHLRDGAKIFLHSKLYFCNRGYFSEFVENILEIGRLQEFLFLRSWGCIMEHEGLTRPTNLSCSFSNKLPMNHVPKVANSSPQGIGIGLQPYNLWSTTQWVKIDSHRQILFLCTAKTLDYNSYFLVV